MRRRAAVALVAAGLVVGGSAGLASVAGAASLERVALAPALLERAGLDVSESAGRRWADVVVHDAADARVLDRLGARRRVLVRDLDASFARARRADLRAAGPSALPSGRTTYRSFADYGRELDALVAAHPGFARKVVLPVRTIEGREITGIEIARGVGGDDGRPVNLVLGLTHPREWPTGEIAMEYARDLLDGRAPDVVDGERTVIVPVANPDGFVATQAGQPLRRRNCRADAGDDASAPCIRRRGVDLNRNFGAFWGGNGASVDPAQDTFRGTGPWSEPEAQAVHELSQGLPITGVVSLHSIASLVLRPPGFRALGLAPDEAGLKRLGDAMGDATGYASEYGYQLYEVTGATEDWNYVAQGAYAYTIELGTSDGDESFQGAYGSHVVDQYLGSGARAGRGVRAALLLGAREAMDPADHLVLTGRVPRGRVLRLSKTFATQTSPICQTDLVTPAGDCLTTTPAFSVPDGLSITQRTGSSGRFTWDVGPSTRPFVAKAGGREAWTLTCAGADGTVLATHEVVGGRGELATVDPCRAGSGVRVAANPALGDSGRRLRATVSRVGRTALLRSGVPVTLRCARACSARVVLTVGGARAGSRLVRLGAFATRTVRAAVGGGTALRARVRAGAPVVVTVRLRDTAGSRVVRRTLR